MPGALHIQQPLGGREATDKADVRIVEFSSGELYFHVYRCLDVYVPETSLQPVVYPRGIRILITKNYIYPSFDTELFLFR